MTSTPYPSPKILPQDLQWGREARELVNHALTGKLAGGGEVTLDANDTTTALVDPLIGPQSRIHLTPLTANAAGALAGLYVSARVKGEASLTHANTAAVDKTFAYSVVG
jgi:hypothetical protein